MDRGGRHRHARLRRDAGESRLSSGLFQRTSEGEPVKPLRDTGNGGSGRAIARMDEDGHVFVEDRIDDIMNTGGGEGLPERDRGRHRRTRRRIRGSDHRHPGRATRRVDDRGRRCDGIVSEDDMEARCRERLTDYERPCRIEFVDELPKTYTPEDRQGVGPRGVVTTSHGGAGPGGLCGPSRFGDWRRTRNASGTTHAAPFVIGGSSSRTRPACVRTARRDVPGAIR